MPKTTSNRGAVELPLTYVYAVLIGIVVFIVAMRIVSVQTAVVTSENEAQFLATLNGVVEGVSSEPNVIQNVSIGRATIELSWVDGGRISTGAGSQRLGVPTFAARELDARTLSAWTHHYGLETMSSPILYLSDGSLRYQLVGASIVAPYGSETPPNPTDYGLDISTSTTVSPSDTTRDLCIQQLGSNDWTGCEVMLITNDPPYGYLSFDEANWHPVLTYASAFGALFSADEASWLSAIGEARTRSSVTRDILQARADTLGSTSPSNSCDMIYGNAVGELSKINNAISNDLDDFNPILTPQISLAAFDDIKSALTALDTYDGTLATRSACPEVLR